ncbi:MAG TPA: CoA transferase [Candidatus Binataceae bacterium]|nr:CoA transferase [Candidatus Binataceae bacterium]
METFRHVMDGYTVIDFTQMVAGPTAGRVMADLGAEVIKIEMPPRGDGGRAFGVFKDGHSAFFVQHNRGKKSLCVNPKTPEGAEIMRGLIAKADVFLENFTPGAVARMGLDYESVRKINPRMVMCSISSFGQTGPLAHKPGYDTSGACYSGILDMQGDPNGSPVMPGGSVGDINAGISAVAAIGYALLHRERTGRGQYLDISLLDVYFHAHDRSVHIYSATKGATVPHRSGRFVEFFCPSGIFKSKENFILVIAATPGQWASLCQAMGRPELGNDPRYDSGPKREAMGVIPMIEAWLQTLPSDEAAIKILEEHHVPTAPVLTVPQAMNHPHLRQRGTVISVKDRVYGTLEVPASPLRFSDYGQLDLVAASLGEHNTEVLTKHLSYSADRIRELEASGVIASAKS